MWSGWDPTPSAYRLTITGGVLRTSDRTYMQTLGFNDPDKSNPLHDKACAYLATMEKGAKLLRLFKEDKGGTNIKGGALISHPMAAMAGRYERRPILGYADVFWCLEEKGDNDRLHCALNIVVEVKARPVSFASILQQLKTYQSFLPAMLMSDTYEIVLATLYRIPAAEKALYEMQGFAHIYLDPAAVESWYAESRAKADDSETF